MNDLISGRGCRYHISHLLVIVVPLILLLILVPAIPKSYSHAFVIKSYPSPSQSLSVSPRNVDVYFSEPVDLRYSKLTVLDSNGKQVDNKDIKNINGDQMTLYVTLPSGQLKDGVYTVVTKVLSQIDGHVTDNAFVYGVGKSGASKNLSAASGANTSRQGSQLYIPDAIARFPTLIAQVIIVGSAFATLWLWRPISKINWLENILSQTRKSIERRFIFLVIIASAILVISDFGIIYVQAASINVGIGGVIMTKFGNILAVRVIQSFILLVFSMLTYRGFKNDKQNTHVPKRETIALFVIGLATLATTSLIGHGAANGKLLPITIDFIHNLAASVWIGGVIYLALVVIPAIKRTRSIEELTKISIISIIIPRFSSIPVVTIGVIVITGPLLMYTLESNLGLTLASLYGKILVVKLLLAAVMIGIGGYHQLIVQRKVYNASVIGVTTGSNAQLITSPNTHKSSYNLNSEIRKGTRWKKIIWRNSNGSTKTKHDSSSIITSFSKSTRVESLVGMVLLLSVAFLVNTGLPASEFQNQLQPNQQQELAVSTSPLSSQTKVAISTEDDDNTIPNQNRYVSTKFLDNGTKVVLSIIPYSIGNNNFKISFMDSTGATIGIKSVQMKFNQIEKGIGPINVDARQISKGVFSANTAALSLSGQWQLQVEGVQSKPNSSNLVAIYDLLVKPSLDQLKFNVREFRIPGNNISQPLYPLYDNSRNVIWVGDTSINSGRIFEFNLNSHKFTEHKINDTNIVTVMALDRNNQIWYVDPLMKRLGHYNPATNENQIYNIPNPDFIASGVALDKNGNLWLTSATTNAILRFNPQSQEINNNLTIFHLPSANATALGVTVDDESGQIWIAEDIGKIANIDPTKDYKITEYDQTGKDNALKDPTGLLIDPKTGDIYISEHEGHAVSVFNPILKKFEKRFSFLNPTGLPFGMALDKYKNLWVAEHIINKIAVIDPRTGEHREVDTPSSSPFVQWITSDSQGNIWLAEQRGNALALVTSIENPSQSIDAASDNLSENNSDIDNQGTISFATPFGLSYADVIGPSISAGIIVSTLFYTKSVIDFKKSMNQVLRRKTAIGTHGRS
jgi:copper transport protein